jgi:hypothetical protein
MKVSRMRSKEMEENFHLLLKRKDSEIHNLQARIEDGSALNNSLSKRLKELEVKLYYRIKNKN